MKKVTQDEMLNWLDGTLSIERRAEVDAYLAQNGEDAQLLADMKDAMSVLQDWNQSESVAVSDNFWPQLRDKLPAKPGSSWSGQLARLSNWILPRREWKLRAGVAVFATCAALATLFFAPKTSTHSVQAETRTLSADEQLFIRQSLVQHRTYAAVQPFGVPPMTLNDGRNQDGDDGDNGGDGSGEYIPQ